MLLNLDRALELMERDRVDALVCSLPENLLYLTDCDGVYNMEAIHGGGGHPEQFAILPRRRDQPATFVCSGAIAGYLVDRPTWMPEVRLCGEPGRAIPPLDSLDPDARAYAELLARVSARAVPAPAVKGAVQALKDLGLDRSRLAVDSLAAWLELREEGLDAIDGYPLLREIRAVKTAEEIERLRKASEVNETGFQALIGAIQPGVSWGELKLAYDLAVVGRGGLPGFWGAGSGPAPYRFNLFDPESPNMARTVKEGDMIKLDIGCTYRRYWADTNRSVAVRCKPPEWFGRVSRALRDAREAYSEFLRPGARMGDAVGHYERVMWEHGLKEFRQAWGHAVGLQCYDHPAPRIHRDTDTLFAEDMVVNMEGGPGVIGLGAHSLENTYRITKSGFERWSADDGIIVEV
jgi:Xaa-Pro aminopeptidase